MPNFDGTGPRGQGPFTGGGRGYCVGYPAAGYNNSVPGHGGFGYGRGLGRRYGRGQGFGRGFGRRWAAPYVSGPYGSEISPKAEAESLKEQARFMQDEITAINQRIKELESVPEDEGDK